jgi:ATP-dependent protease ClpP protease subunit
MSRQTPWRTTNRMFALRQQRNDWYRVRNQVDGPTQLHIYDEIGYFGVSASDLIRDLADVQGPLEVHLNTPGGDVFDGIAIYNSLLARHDVTVHIDGLAASIGSVIAMAGNPVLIARNAQMMIHDGFSMAIGNAQDLRDLAELLDKTSNNIASIYSDHTGRPQSYWRQVMKAETWYDSGEAIDAGLADRLIDSGAGRPVMVTPQDKWDLHTYRNMTRPENQGNLRHGPFTGTHTHEHSSHGNPGPGNASDGWVHSHPHDHQGDGSHDHHPADDETNDDGSKKPFPGAAEPFKKQGSQYEGGLSNAAVDNSQWDGGKAWSNGANSDNPAAFYAAICAGKRSGDKSKQAAWALPHHYHPGDPPNAAGVRAALASLGGARGTGVQGLINRDAAQSHLESHMKDINPDWEPSSRADPSYFLTDDEIMAFANSLKL